ncbi:MAG: hypothetical protein U9R66_11115, partial [Thermodesulfobacteriota bacterium]|nr:hypothetical protein [Thermodesulfobacteriota bacterium]
PSSPDPVYSHMTQYSSQTGLSEAGADTASLLSKHLQDLACAMNLASIRIFTFILSYVQTYRCHYKTPTINRFPTKLFNDKVTSTLFYLKILFSAPIQEQA